MTPLSFLTGCIAMLVIAAVATVITVGIELALRRGERR